MLHDLLVFLPFMICVFWLALNTILSFRIRLYTIFQMLLLVGTLNFMIDGYYSSIYGTPQIYVWFTLLYQIVAPSFIPVTVLYLMKLDKDEPYRPQ